MMKIIHDGGVFPGVPEGVAIGEWTASEQCRGNPWHWVALGDIGLSGRIARSVQRTDTASFLFEEISAALREADYVMANLETPLIEDWNNNKMFAGSRRWASSLADVGIDMLHLASNHMLDHGAAGFSQTISAVKNAGISIIGAGPTKTDAARLVVREFRGFRVGWLGAGHTCLRQPQSPRLWELNVPDLLAAVESQRGKVDVLIVSLHWGPMLIDYPYLEQQQAAHRLVEAGASAVVMHHAHILQGVEIYSGVPICYGLGNCVFDPTEGEFQESSNFEHVKYQDQLSSCIFRLTWCDGAFTRLQVAPFVLGDPENTASLALTWPSTTEAERILTRLGRISEDLKGDFSDKLGEQLHMMRRREIAIISNLVLRHRQYWRIWRLLRQLRARHIRALLGMLVTTLRRCRLSSQEHKV